MRDHGISLSGESSIPWSQTKTPTGFEPIDVVLGADTMGMGLQVAIAEWKQTGDPSREGMKSLHAARQGKSVFPLVVAAVKADYVWVYGPAQDSEVFRLPASRAERLLQAALSEPNGVAARQRLAGLQKAVTSGQHAGVVNQGLFASHYLQSRAPERIDWAAARQRSEKLLGLRHEELVKGLGFTTIPDGPAVLLSEQDAPRAVAVFLNANEQFDADTARFGVSPVAYGLSQAGKREVPWLVVLRGSQLRLYPAKPGVGVGQKGQADTWFEIDLAVVDEDQTPLLALVFSAEALAPNGSISELLAGSAQFAVQLGERLRTRVYDVVIPVLSKSVAEELPQLGIAIDAKGLEVAYRLTMRILFRLLFQAYAEDRELLPYSRSDEYRSHSLKKWAIDHTKPEQTQFDENSTAIWNDLQTVWKVIDNGNSEWRVPAYNGGLFAADELRNPEGFQLTQIELDDSVMGAVLRGLLVDGLEGSSDGSALGAVDFRSLSVREFGTIYEGLLESELSIAPTDLSIISVTEKGKKKEYYAPTATNAEIAVPQGGVYFHSRSGERKATGTYFTPSIVVEHLLQRTLVPVLDEHLQRVGDALAADDRARAAELFFDFRVIDMSMGSAHFLTAAIDHIEAKMRDFLTDHPIPAVMGELTALEKAAHEALGVDAAAVADTDTAALLRRQIARRCIYGIDVNPMAVELARLAIWITTFVPGLPMSSLDHTLACANSLTGVGTLDEALAVLDPNKDPNQISFLTEPISESLGQARELLIDVANASEATKADVSRGLELSEQARNASEPARLLFDAVVAARLGKLKPANFPDVDSLLRAVGSADVQEAVAAIRPAHLPYLFPEVFLRPQSGFDVILGNPPWDKLKVEEHAWWAVRFPGLRSLSQKDKNEAIAEHRLERPDLVEAFEVEVAEVKAAALLVNSGPFPGIGAGDIDLMAAFAWRFVHAVSRGGAIGVVLPRTAFAGSGLEQWRRELLENGSIADLTMLVNNRQWVFPSIHPQYTVALLSYRPSKGSECTVALQGPYSSREAFVVGTNANAPARFSSADVLGWNATAAFPLLPDEQSLPVFVQMRTHPDFGSESEPLGFRPLAELHTTKEKPFYDFNLEEPGEGMTLPVLTGASFNLWDPDFGEPYAFANPKVIEDYLQKRRLKQVNTRSSAFFGMPAEWARDTATLPMHHPRIAFRDVARATDTRTMLCALVPGNQTLVEKAPYLARRDASSTDEAFVLGVLSSRIFDWYARRHVENKVSYGLLNSFPIPRPAADSARRARVVEISGRLAAVDERFAEWAAEVGVRVGSASSPEERDALIAELDALIAQLYGLTEDQLRVVFETFHVGWDFESRLNLTLEYYKEWEGAE